MQAFALAKTRLTNSKVLRTLGNGLFGLLLAFIVFLAYGNLPNRWYHILYINSGSMFPVIQPGDIILITPPPAVLKPQMILTLSVNGSLVTHRLVGFGEYGELITQGDANAVVDNWNEATIKVVGLYRGRIPYLGYLAVLPGQLAQLVASGAWFSAAEEIPGELSAHANWTAPQQRVDLRGSLGAVPFLENGQQGVTLDLCLQNQGGARVEGLNLASQIEVDRGPDGMGEVLSAFLDVSARSALEAGEEHCYESSFWIGPAEPGRYRAEVQVMVAQPPAGATENLALAEAGAVPIALELTTEFDLAEPPLTPAAGPTAQVPTAVVDTPTESAPPTEVATPEAPQPVGTSLEAELTVTSIGMAADDPGRAKVGGEVCVRNTGRQATEALAFSARVQFKITDNAYVDLLEAGQPFAAPAQLAPDTQQCYPIEITFAPMPGAEYQLAVRVSLTNQADGLPGGPACPGPTLCALGPEARASFALPQAADEQQATATLQPEPSASMAPLAIDTPQP